MWFACTASLWKMQAPRGVKLIIDKVEQDYEKLEKKIASPVKRRDDLLHRRVEQGEGPPKMKGGSSPQVRFDPV